VILQDVAEKARAVTERHEVASLLELEIGGALHPKSLACYLEAGDGNFVAEHGTTHRDSGIVSWGINPRTFTGRYESQLSSPGITPEDWSAILGAKAAFTEASRQRWTSSFHKQLRRYCPRILVP